MPSIRWLTPIAAALVVLLSVTEPTHAYAGSESCLDVAIVLAVDGSGSIDTQEFYLQQQGIVAALRDPSVQRAIAHAGKVAIAVLYWGDSGWPTQDTPFFVIADNRDIEELVARIESMPRRVLGSTGLSTGISAALDKLETVPCAYRSVINVSGDGRDTVMPRRRGLAPTLDDVKARAAALGVTINGIVITNEDEDLKSYFQRQVITGPNAFVMKIEGFEHYAEALRRKLVREIGAVSLSRN